MILLFYYCILWYILHLIHNDALYFYYWHGVKVLPCYKPRPCYQLIINFLNVSSNKCKYTTCKWQANLGVKPPKLSAFFSSPDVLTPK